MAPDHPFWTPRIGERSKDGPSTAKPGAKPMYLAIADAIAEDIRGGRLADGERLPPQRRLADHLGIDFTTVSRAYNEARHRGLVSARVGQGTFVQAPPQAAPSPASPAEAPAAAPERAPARAPALVDMTMNQPPAPDAPALLDRMRRTVAEVAGTLALTDLLHYPDADSRHENGAAGVRWLDGRLPGLTPDRVLAAPGTQGALLALLTLLARPGDAVCAEALTYPGFRAVAAQLGLTVVGVPMDADGVDPDALRAAFAAHKPKAFYSVPTLHNPTTATLPLDRRHAIVAAAREHGVTIIEDDIYGTLPTDSPPPLAALGPDVTLHVAGLAKCVSPLLRIAYVAAPDAREAARLAKAQRAVTLMASPLTTAVARRWIADGTAQAVRDAIRAEAVERRALAQAILPPDSFATQPEAFHLWLRLPESWTRGEFAAHLGARGIAAVAADAFATTPDAPQALRICLGAPATRAETRRVLTVVAEAMEQLPVSASVII